MLRDVAAAGQLPSGIGIGDGAQSGHCGIDQGKSQKRAFRPAKVVGCRIQTFTLSFSLVHARKHIAEVTSRLEHGYPGGGNGSGGIKAVEGKYIYWTSNGGAGVWRAETNGTDVNQNFITGRSGVNVFLTVDKSYIYWADSDDGSGSTIGRATIDGTDVDESFITGVLGPFGIAVTGGSK